ncbi:MAG: peptidoglycan DD-metalloendopeptidase family protein [Rhodocyclaceae bacterium]
MPSDVSTPQAQSIEEDLSLPAYEYVDAIGTPFVHEWVVRTGDTLPSVLGQLGVQDAELTRFITSDPAARPVVQLLKPGTLVMASTSRQGQLFTLSIPKPGGETAVLVTRESGKLAVKEQAILAEKRIHMAGGVIRSSLFAATDEAGLPDSVATSLADIFGSEVDFHRDLRRGDRFNVVYEVAYFNGAPVRTGRILAAEFINAGTRYSAIWYGTASGRGEYYTAEGRSLRQGFLRSPLEFSRVSSGFSMRFHPILKQWRKHAGTDFAAATGTKVRATADGVVDFAGWQNGYGNIVVLRHDRGYSTAYAHLSRFAPNLRKGMRVSQSDLIAFVGSTGWATGPHLHYEFRVNNVPKDAMKVALPGGTPLSGSQLAEFRRKTTGVLARLAIADEATAVALGN